MTADDVVTAVSVFWNAVTRDTFVTKPKIPSLPRVTLGNLINITFKRPNVESDGLPKRLQTEIRKVMIFSTMRQNEELLAFIFLPTLFQKYGYLALYKMYSFDKFITNFKNLDGASSCLSVQYTPGKLL
jgi:hypothetical protein